MDEDTEQLDWGDEQVTTSPNDAVNVAAADDDDAVSLGGDDTDFYSAYGKAAAAAPLKEPTPPRDSPYRDLSPDRPSTPVPKDRDLPPKPQTGTPLRHALPAKPTFTASNSGGAGNSSSRRSDNSNNLSRSSEWQEVWSTTKDRYYYFNSITNTTTWDKPADFTPASEDPPKPAKRGRYDDMDTYVPGRAASPPRRKRGDRDRQPPRAKDNGDSWIAPGYEPPPPGLPAKPVVSSGSSKRQRDDVYIPSEGPESTDSLPPSTNGRPRGRRDRDRASSRRDRDQHPSPPQPTSHINHLPSLSFVPTLEDNEADVPPEFLQVSPSVGGVEDGPNEKVDLGDIKAKLESKKRDYEQEHPRGHQDENSQLPLHHGLPAKPNSAAVPPPSSPTIGKRKSRFGDRLEPPNNGDSGVVDGSTTSALQEPARSTVREDRDQSRPVDAGVDREQNSADMDVDRSDADEGSEKRSTTLSQESAHADPSDYRDDVEGQDRAEYREYRRGTRSLSPRLSEREGRQQHPLPPKPSSSMDDPNRERQRQRSPSPPPVPKRDRKPLPPQRAIYGEAMHPPRGPPRAPRTGRDRVGDLNTPTGPRRDRGRDRSSPPPPPPLSSPPPRGSVRDADGRNAMRGPRFGGHGRSPVSDQGGRIRDRERDPPPHIQNAAPAVAPRSPLPPPAQEEPKETVFSTSQEPTSPPPQAELQPQAPKGGAAPGAWGRRAAGGAGGSPASLPPVDPSGSRWRGGRRPAGGPNSIPIGQRPGAGATAVVAGGVDDGARGGRGSRSPPPVRPSGNRGGGRMAYDSYRPDNAIPGPSRRDTRRRDDSRERDRSPDGRSRNSNVDQRSQSGEPITGVGANGGGSVVPSVYPSRAPPLDSVGGGPSGLPAKPPPLTVSRADPRNGHGRPELASRLSSHRSSTPPPYQPPSLLSRMSTDNLPGQTQGTSSVPAKREYEDARDGEMYEGEERPGDRERREVRGNKRRRRNTGGGGRRR